MIGLMLLVSLVFMFVLVPAIVVGALNVLGFTDTSPFNPLAWIAFWVILVFLLLVF